jgi:D-lactate dehydrogenase
MPSAAPRLPVTNGTNPAAVYFPSCVTRTVGAMPDETDDASTAAAFVAVAARAGRPLQIRDDAGRYCCGQPYSSKGFPEAHAIAINATVEALWTASREGTLPIVVDTSPCTYSLKGHEGLTPENKDRASRMRVMDGVTRGHASDRGRYEPVHVQPEGP